jgi:SAM-dependent methyltransferase
MFFSYISESGSSISTFGIKGVKLAIKDIIINVSHRIKTCCVSGKQINAEDFMPPQDLSPMHVDVDADPPQIQALLDRIKSEWEGFGKDEPHWSVLTHDDYKQKSLAKNKNEFYKSGEFVADIIKAFVKRNDLSLENYKTCFELGCGVGRVTLHLSHIFKHVTGVDISKFHLDICREELRQSDVRNVSLVCITDINQLHALPSFDFFCSFIVLQHNPPPIIKLMLERILDKLDPGGVAIFQVPTFRETYHFDLDQYLKHPKPLHMEMHVLPQPHVFSILKKANCDLVEIREDGWAAGRTPHGLSNTFFVTKQRV